MKKLLIILVCIMAVVVFALRSCQAETGEPSEIIPSATNQVTLTITESNSTQAT